MVMHPSPNLDLQKCRKKMVAKGGHTDFMFFAPHLAAGSATDTTEYLTKIL